MLSAYHDIGSPVHALPAWTKLTALFVVGLGVFLVDDGWVLGAALLGVLAGFVVARVPWRLITGQVRFAVPFLVLVAVGQVLLVGWQNAVVVTVRLLVVLLLAGLVTLTTRAADLVAVVETLLGPLRRFGVAPERVGLAIMLTIRFVPVIKAQAEAVRAAQRARGVERSAVFLTPLLVKTLRMADGVAEALDARGLDAAPSGRSRPTTGG